MTRLNQLEFERQEAKHQAELLPTRDFLAGLPNRVVLEDRISNATARAERSGGLVGVAAVDMDGFKAINYNYGHAAGDTIPNEIARRMKGAIRQADAVTRLDGDEFILLATDTSTLDNLMAAIHRLLNALYQAKRQGKICLVFVE